MSATTEESPAGSWLEVARRRVGAIRFGSVQNSIHEGRVTQVEAVKRTRFQTDKVEAAHRPAN